MDRPLTVKEAAARLGIAPRTVYALCEQRRLPHYRLGPERGSIRLRAVDLDAYLASALVPVGSTRTAVPERPRPLASVGVVHLRDFLPPSLRH